MTNLEELLILGSNTATKAVEASKTENIGLITDLLVELASVAGSINVELFKAHTKKLRAKDLVDDEKAKIRLADMDEGGSAVHAEAKAAAHAIPLNKLMRVADEHYRYIKTFVDNYQTIIEVLRSRVSALKTEQKNL